MPHLVLVAHAINTDHRHVTRVAVTLVPLATCQRRQREKPGASVAKVYRLGCLILRAPETVRHISNRHRRSRPSAVERLTLRN